ncbi:unnamed protein product [Amoebophrya sp. A120]|nr:unnamed protein product [Amoebophrya sp. A120]|eukprot:GSA120T00010270001.1
MTAKIVPAMNPLHGVWPAVLRRLLKEGAAEPVVLQALQRHLRDALELSELSNLFEDRHDLRLLATADYEWNNPHSQRQEEFRRDFKEKLLDKSASAVRGLVKAIYHNIRKENSFFREHAGGRVVDECLSVLQEKPSSTPTRATGSDASATERERSVHAAQNAETSSSSSSSPPRSAAQLNGAPAASEDGTRPGATESLLLEPALLPNPRNLFDGRQILPKTRFRASRAEERAALEEFYTRPDSALENLSVFRTGWHKETKKWVLRQAVRKMVQIIAGVRAIVAGWVSPINLLSAASAPRSYAAAEADPVALAFFLFGCPIPEELARIEDPVYLDDQNTSGEEEEEDEDATHSSQPQRPDRVAVVKNKFMETDTATHPAWELPPVNEFDEDASEDKHACADLYHYNAPSHHRSILHFPDAPDWTQRASALHPTVVRHGRCTVLKRENRGNAFFLNLDGGADDDGDRGGGGSSRRGGSRANHFRYAEVGTTTTTTWTSHGNETREATAAEFQASLASWVVFHYQGAHWWTDGMAARTNIIPAMNPERGLWPAIFRVLCNHSPSAMRAYLEVARDSLATSNSPGRSAPARGDAAPAVGVSPSSLLATDAEVAEALRAALDGDSAARNNSSSTQNVDENDRGGAFVGRGTTSTVNHQQEVVEGPQPTTSQAPSAGSSSTTPYINRQTRIGQPFCTAVAREVLSDVRVVRTLVRHVYQRIAKHALLGRHSQQCLANATHFPGSARAEALRTRMVDVGPEEKHRWQLEIWEPPLLPNERNLYKLNNNEMPWMEAEYRGSDLYLKAPVYSFETVQSNLEKFYKGELPKQVDEQEFEVSLGPILRVDPDGRVTEGSLATGSRPLPRGIAIDVKSAAVGAAMDTLDHVRTVIAQVATLLGRFSSQQDSGSTTPSTSAADQQANLVYWAFFVLGCPGHPPTRFIAAWPKDDNGRTMESHEIACKKHPFLNARIAGHSDPEPALQTPPGRYLCTTLLKFGRSSPVPLWETDTVTVTLRQQGVIEKFLDEVVNGREEGLGLGHAPSLAVFLQWWSEKFNRHAQEY